MIITDPSILEVPDVKKKEVHLEDKNKTLSYPGDMHDDDVKFHLGVTEYQKSPMQAYWDSMSDSVFWNRQEQKAKDLWKAIPQLLTGVGQNMVEDVKDVGRMVNPFNFEISKGLTPERRAADRNVLEAGSTIANSLIETFLGRIVEPVRTFAGDVVTGHTQDLAADVSKAFIDPSAAKKITDPQNIPFTEAERSGGVTALIPRAVAGAIEDVLFYGTNFKDIPKLLDNYQINTVKNVMRDNTAIIHQNVMRLRNINEDQAWAWMNTQEGTSQIYYAAQQYLKKQKPTLYSGTPLPGGDEIKAVGQTVRQTADQAITGAAQSPQLGAKVLNEALKERQFITSIKEELPELKVSGMYIPRSTDTLAIKARTLIEENLPLAEKMAYTGTDDAAIATGAELLKYYTNLAEANPAIADALYEKAANLGNDMAVRLTELGRSVQAASILARQTPEGQIRFAAKTIQKYNEQVEKDAGIFALKKKIPELTPEQTHYIAEKVKQVGAMPDGEEKAMAWRDVQNYISDTVPTPLLQKITTVWKAGLLTGLKTSGLNIFSNASHAFGTEILKDIPAAAVDSVASLFTKQRTVAFTTKGLVSGTKEGFNKGVKFLKSGYDERDALSKFDYKRVSFGKGKVAKALQVYEETVFKVLGAEDQPFYYGAKARSIAEQAIVQAKNKGLKGKEAESFVDNLIQNPTDDMVTLAVSDAEAAVFQQKTVLSEAAGNIKNIPGAEFLIPFTKTPSAVAVQILRYTPVGSIYKIIKGIGQFDQREFSKDMGRGITGLSLLFLGGYLLRNGQMSLDRPTSEGKQKLDEAAGKKPNSILIGDKWRSISTLGPAGNILLIGGQFADAMDRIGSPTGAASVIEANSVALSKSLKSFTQQTFLTGLSSFTDALTDPLRSSEKFTSGLVSSAVPTIIADVARATDPLERRVEGIGDALAARIPIIRQNLQPQVDILGQPRFVKENFFEVMADPSRPVTQTNNPIVSEIQRLVAEGHPISTTLAGDRKGYSILTKEQNTDLWQRSGGIALDKVTSYMQMANYDNVPDDEKARDIDHIFDKAKEVARAEKVLEITEGLEGEALKEKLSEAKRSGLLNRSVLERYKRMR